MKRFTDERWQFAGAAVLTGWLLAACGPEWVGKPGETGRGVAATGPSASVPPVAATAPTRRIAATIETGQITHIERIVVTPASGASKGAAASDGLTVYRVVVRLQDGRSHEFTEPSLGELKVGDRVQVVRGGPQPTT